MKTCIHKPGQKALRLARALGSCLVLASCEALAVAALYDVTGYGAKGDGHTLATAAIQKAVDACGARGGGRVIMPPGRYVTGPIFLRDHVHLELEAGAVLAGSTNVADYPAIEGRWEGIERKVYASLLTGRGLQHVSITGRGIIDGRGAVWWEAHRRTGELRKELGVKGREPENPPGAPLRWPRPRLINLYNCTNVLIRDLTLLNAPSWNVHPVYCENVTVDNLTIVSPAHSPNTDGVNPDSCRNVRISNCHIDVGDDCIVIKSGYNEDGRRVGIPCEDVLVSNCSFGHGHGGVVIGSEMSGSVRNVTVVNCIFDGTERGLRVKTALGRGGVIENFRASDLVMRNISDAAFSITAAYGDSQSGPQTDAAAAASIPAMRHIRWSRVTVDKVGKVALLSGLESAPLEDFSLEDVQATRAKSGIRCENGKRVRFESIEIETASGPAVEARRVSELEVCRLRTPRPNGVAPVILLEQVSGAVVSGCRVSEGPGVFLELAGADDDDVTCAGNRLAKGVEERKPK